jgi:hypothetical protein
MNVQSREARVKVSDKIYGALYGLIKSEKDYESKKKKHAAKWYRDKVANILELKDRDNPSLRSFEEYIKAIKRTLIPLTPLDRPWCIGVCSKYSSYFPPESIPVLLELKKILYDPQVDPKYGLLIRDAIWFIRLKPLIEKIYPPDKVMQYASEAAECYAQAEELSQSRGESYFDTSEYDNKLSSGNFDSFYREHLDKYFGGKEL